ncbi:MAG: T9SS type A sorting domain-containing protein [Chitinophagales bacterium]
MKRIKRIPHGAHFIIISFAILYVHVCHAQAGYLDTTFGGGDGFVTEDLGGSDVINALDIQDDGKIVVAGQSNIDTGLINDIVLMRYNEDGSPDMSFGTDGKVYTDCEPGYSNDIAYGLTIQSDEKIIVTGTSQDLFGYRLVLLRYEIDGTLDITFGTGGISIIELEGIEDVGRSVIVLNDGKILVAGYRNDGLKRNFALIRCLNNGTLDETFGTGGIVYTSFATNRHDSGYSMGLQIDGKIVVGGYSFVGTSSDFQFALARYNIDGSLDMSFDDDGMVLTDYLISKSLGFSLVVQHDNKIVLAGYSFIADDVDFGLARYNSDGSLDNSFGGDGIVNADFGLNYEDNAYSLAIQPDGKFVAAGDTWNGDNWDFAVARFNDDGILDTTFNADGLVTTPIGESSDGIFSIKLQDDGKIVAGGYSRNGFENNFAVARYNGFTDIEISILEDDVTEIINISPNPFGNELKIDCSKGGRIILADALGNELMKKNISAGSFLFNTADLLPGIYFVNFFDGDGCENYKLMKQ